MELVWYWELLKALLRQAGRGKVATWAASVQVDFWGHKDGKRWWPTLGAGVMVSDVTAENSKSSGDAVSAQTSPQMGTHFSTFKYLASLSAFYFYVVQM